MKREPIGSLFSVNIAGMLLCYQRYGKAATRCFNEFEAVATLHDTLGNDVSLRIALVVSIGSIGIDRAVVLATFFQEIEFNGALMRIPFLKM